MRLAFLIFKHYRGFFAASSLVGVVSGGANIFLLAIISKNLALYQQGQEPAYTLAAFGWAALGAAATGMAASLINLFISTKLTHQLQLNMAHQIMNLGLRRQEEVGEARLIATFTQDIRAITNATLAIPNLFLDAGMTLGGLVYLGMLSTEVLAILIAFLVFCIVSYLIPERAQIRLTEKMRAAINRLMTRFVAMNQGAKELALHYGRRETMFNRELRGSADELLRTTRAQGVLGAAINNWLRLMYFVFIAILVFVLPNYSDLDIVTLMGYALVAMFIRAPVMNLIGSRAVFRAAGVAFRTTEDIGLRLTAGVGRNPFTDKEQTLARIADAPPFRELVLEGVRHVYARENEDRPFTLGPLDLTVRAGEILFIIGGNGSGKTTLAKIIAGLYPPETGRVLLNGKPVDDEEDRELSRQYFSAVFSDFYIFEELLGLDAAGLDQRAQAYLAYLNIDRKVAIEDGKLSTVNLSTGQRKRLALLTAYLEDRPVYLFDEWAADQDPEFKNVFYHRILPDLKAKGKTAIVISHDDRYFDVADRVVKLVDGQLQQEPNRSGPNPPPE